MVAGSTAETRVFDTQLILPLALHKASAERVQFKVLLKCSKKNPGENPAQNTGWSDTWKVWLTGKKLGSISKKKAQGDAFSLFVQKDKEKEAIDFPPDLLGNEWSNRFKLQQKEI